VLVLLLAAAAAAWFVRRDDAPAPRASACSASIGPGCVAMRDEVITERRREPTEVGRDSGLPQEANAEART